MRDPGTTLASATLAHGRKNRHETLADPGKTPKTDARPTNNRHKTNLPFKHSLNNKKNKTFCSYIYNIRKATPKRVSTVIVDAERHRRTLGCWPFERKAIRCEALADARDAGGSQAGTEI